MLQRSHQGKCVRYLREAAGYGLVGSGLPRQFRWLTSPDLHAQQAIALFHGAESEHHDRPRPEASLYPRHHLGEHDAVDGHAVYCDHRIAHLFHGTREGRVQGGIMNTRRGVLGIAGIAAMKTKRTRTYSRPNSPGHRFA